MQRESDQSGYGVPGISISYEFVANVIEVFPKQITVVQLLLRLCSVAGGVFATSAVLHTIVSGILSYMKITSKS
jgi:hypothetical protein